MHPSALLSINFLDTEDISEMSATANAILHWPRADGMA